jgi:hypothetical protein
MGKGEHQLDLLFHPAPLASGEGLATRVRPVTLQVNGDQSVVTAEPGAANVAILPAHGAGCQVFDLIGQANPVRGWYAFYGIIPSHDIAYRWRGPLPRHFETVIQPLLTSRARPMKVAARPVTCAGKQSCAAVACGDDLFLISYDGPAEMRCGEVEFQGTALLLARDGQGRALYASAVDGRALRVGGQPLTLDEL